MKIAFDIDGVVLNSIEIILDYLNRTDGKDLTPDDLFAWDLEPLGMDLETLREAVFHMYSMPSIDPYEGAVEALSRIYSRSGGPLLFITGRSSLESAERQLDALPWNGGKPEMIVTGGDRYKMPYFQESGADFIIEDDPEHLEKYLEAGIGVGLMMRPWNKASTVPATRRFTGWPDLEEWFFREICSDREPV